MKKFRILAVFLTVAALLCAYGCDTVDPESTAATESVGAGSQTVSQTSSEDESTDDTLYYYYEGSKVIKIGDPVEDEAYGSVVVMERTIKYLKDGELLEATQRAIKVGDAYILDFDSGVKNVRSRDGYVVVSVKADETTTYMLISESRKVLLENEYTKIQYSGSYGCAEGTKCIIFKLSGDTLTVLSDSYANVWQDIEKQFGAKKSDGSYVSVLIGDGDALKEYPAEDFDEAVEKYSAEFKAAVEALLKSVAAKNDDKMKKLMTSDAYDSLKDRVS
ncbi:MAG TPA: hypothetical protein PLT66_05670 [Bacillota bacterium]|nr:hypothetical protein [Bacillota bacterium]